MSQGSESDNDFESADEGDEVATTRKDVSTEKPIEKCKDENKKSEKTVDLPKVTETQNAPTTETDQVDKILKGLTIGDSPEKPTPQTGTITEDIKHAKPEKQVLQSNPVPKEEKVLLLKEKKELERAAKNTEGVKDLKLPAQPPEEKNSPGWGLVGGWSSSFLSTVASSASTFTSHVTQGIGTVLESVEATLGAPTPEEMAAMNRKAQKPEEVVEQVTTEPEEQPEAGSGVVPELGHAVGGLFGGVSAFTRVLESTGSKVIYGGLDTLELIGKKTMDILTEGDPGLRKRRTIFTGGTDSTLSQALREAKNRFEEGHGFDDNADEAPIVHYSKVFDDNQGLVHLEALEILSGRSKAHLEEQLLLLGPDAKSLHTTLQELRTACLDLPPTDDTPDDEATQDFEKLVNEHMSALPVNLSIDKIKSVQTETRNWVNTCKQEQDKGQVQDAKEIYEKIISSLAKLTAKSMELFHKMAELLLVTGGDLADLHSYAQHFTGLTSVLCTEVGILTSYYCQCLSTAADDSEDPDAINPLITNVYLEASNSNTYIQDAFQLLIPVFQELAVGK